MQFSQALGVCAVYPWLGHCSGTAIYFLRIIVFQQIVSEDVSSYLAQLTSSMLRTASIRIGKKEQDRLSPLPPSLPRPPSPLPLPEPGPSLPPIRPRPPLPLLGIAFRRSVMKTAGSVKLHLTGHEELSDEALLA